MNATDPSGEVCLATALGHLAPYSSARALAANRRHSTVHATGLVDLEAKVIIDMV